MGLYEFNGKKPRVDPEAYISPRASLIGDIEVGADSSIWEFAVLRADMNYIRVGKGTSIQDNATVHTTFMHPTIIGDYVTAGHNCVIHACKIGDRAVVGMGSIVLDGAEVGNDCVIGAGSVVTNNSVIPDGSLVMGIPGKVVKEVSEALRESFMTGAQLYIELGKSHKKSGSGKSG
ncbi:MAG: gamma carbonic anhydrase family protein [Candidatus Thorarchaeota archaeon]|nr:MAG: gamma carbonic anhydrase family protein [Candidatus Thorarchaeota archaeon]